MCHGPARGNRQQQSDLARSFRAVRRPDTPVGGEKSAENQIGKGQHDVEIAKVAFVVQAMMGVQSTKPGGVSQPPLFGDIYAAGDNGAVTGVKSFRGVNQRCSEVSNLYFSEVSNLYF